MEQWQNWCRICAKSDPSDNINVLETKSKQGTEKSSEYTNKIGNLSLEAYIEKFFWVKITPDGDLPKSICKQCFTLVSSLVEFSKRTIKVQEMFWAIHFAKINANVSADYIRSAHRINDEDRLEIIFTQRKITKNEEEEEETFDPFENFYIEPIEELVDYDFLVTSDGDALGDHDYEVFSITDVDTKSDEIEEYFEEVAIVLDSEIAQQEGNQINYDQKNNGKINKGQINKQQINNGQTHVINPQKNKSLINNPQVNIAETNNVLINNPQIKNGIINNLQINKPEINNVQIHVNDPQLNNGQIHLNDPQINEVLINNPQKNNAQLTYVMENKSCETDLKSENNVKSQEIDDEATEYYPCKHCSLKFLEVEDYSNHMSFKHPGCKAEITCKQCNVKFDRVCSWKQHMYSHISYHSFRTTSCTLCTRKFLTQEHVERHMKLNHFASRPHVCDKCGYTARLRSHLETHMISHKDERPFECEICNKKFKRKLRLNRHLETHKDRTCICPICGLQLSSPGSLRQHEVVHSENRPYKCIVCEKAFKRGDALRHHMNSHTGARPYACEYCENKYMTPSELRAHKKRRHPVELAAQDEARQLAMR